MSDTDDFTLDFTGVKAAGFDPLPAGWYLFEVTAYDDIEVENPGGKLALGTPGTNWEFTVHEGDFEGRKCWTRHYHVAKSLPFMKKLLKASGAFTDEELDGPISLDDRDRVEGQLLWLKLKLVPETAKWDAKNEVRDYKHQNERQSESTGDSDSLMP